jgi:hypothetical protein
MTYMIAITGKVSENGHETIAKVMVPSNHTEAQSVNVNAWGLVIAGGLLLLATTFICLLLFAA